MFLKILRMSLLVFALIVASAAPGSAQTTVFVNGNTSFTVTWSGSVGGGATLLAQATFTVSNWTGSSFVMTVNNVKNTMPTSPDIQARLTAFGFGLTPDGTFSNQVGGSIYNWAFTNFPAFQRVDVCLTSGGGCAGGGNGGLNQGQSDPSTMSITITGNFANGVTITPIPAKFQTSLGSLETDGVVINPPPTGPSDLTIAKVHTPNIAIPGGDSHVHRDGQKRRGRSVERHGDRDRNAAAWPDSHGALWPRVDLHSPNMDLHSKRRARPGASYPGITVTTMCRSQCDGWHGDEQRSSYQAAGNKTRAITPLQTRRSSPFRLRRLTSRLRRGTVWAPSSPGRPSRTP